MTAVAPPPALCLRPVASFPSTWIGPVPDSRLPCLPRKIEGKTQISHQICLRLTSRGGCISNILSDFHSLEGWGFLCLNSRRKWHLPLFGGGRSALKGSYFSLCGVGPSLTLFLRGKPRQHSQIQMWIFHPQVLGVLFRGWVCL